MFNIDTDFWCANDEATCMSRDLNRSASIGMVAPAIMYIHHESNARRGTTKPPNALPTLPEATRLGINVQEDILCCPRDDGTSISRVGAITKN